VDGQHHYNRAAVDRAIQAHNRRPRGGRVGGREAKLIHAVLRGRTPAASGERDE